MILALIFTASHLASAEQLHVCTVASRSHPNLEKLIASCEQNKIQLEILGMGQPYGSNMDKLRFMRSYCEQLPDDDMILFVDAFDMLILADQDEIASRFLSLNVPMLMAAEILCWPLKGSAKFHTRTASPFKYINTGGYIGWVKAIKRWLNAFDEILLSGTSDQGAAQKLMMKKKYYYAIDHACAIFLCLYRVPTDAVYIDSINKKITCAYTNSTPCVLHANGGSFQVWDQVYSSFFEPQINP